MNEALVTVKFDHVNGLARDAVAMQFPIRSTTDPVPDFDWDPVVGALSMFFNAVTAGGSKIANFLSPELKRTGSPVHYDVFNLVGHLDGSPHGSPVYSTDGGLQPSISANGLPGEVACVLTTRANGWDEQPVEAPDGGDAGTALDRPRQRYSGRMFFGPLDINAISMVGGVCRPHPNLLLTLQEASVRLQAALFDVDASWCVWSRKDATFRLVTDVQTDDAFDTQRRRGVGPTARITVPTPWS